MPEFVGKKNNRKTDDFVLLKRRKEVVELYLCGKNQWDIALYLRENGWPEITQKTVSVDLAWMDKRWLENLDEDVRLVKAREIAKLRAIQEMAFDSFAKSCMDHVTKKRTIEKAPKFVKEAEQPTKEMEKKLGRKFTKIRGKPVVEPVSDEEEMRILKEVVEISKSGSAGDPRWLSLAKDCSETILKIYGVGKEQNNNTINVINNWWDDVIGRDPSQDDKPLEKKLEALALAAPVEDTVDAEVVEPELEDIEPEEMTLEQALEDSQVGDE